MATHSSVLAWEWTEEPGELQSMGSGGTHLPDITASGIGVTSFLSQGG